MAALVFVLLFLIFTIILSLKDRKKSLYYLFFLAPWAGLDADIGLRVTLYQVVLIGVIASLIIRFLIGDSKKPYYPDKTPLLVFMIYTVVWSLAKIPFLPEHIVSGGTLRQPEARAIIQIGMFLFTISPVLLVPALVRKPQDVADVGRGYLWSIFILATIGWVQLLVWYSTGRNPIPIGLINNILGGIGREREGSYDFMNLAIYRMSSFGGEPKDLGASVIIAMLIVQVVLFAKKTVHQNKLVILWIYFAFTAFATLSTTAFLLWIIGTTTHLISQKIFPQKPGKEYFYSLRKLGSLFIFIVLLGMGVRAAGIPVWDMTINRTVGRITQSQFGVFEDFDDAIIDYFADHPISALTGVGLGNIHLYADSYLAPEVAVYAGGGVFVAKAQYLRFISEIGIIGLSLFLFWFWRLIILSNRKIRTLETNQYITTVIPFGAANLLVYLAAGATAPQFYLSAGLISAVYSVYKNNKL